MNDDADTIALEVDERRCIRCGACALLAPRLFSVGAGASEVTVEGRLARGEAARVGRASVLICPTLAIRARDVVTPEAIRNHEAPQGPASASAPASAAPAASTSTASEARIYPWIARLSERVRWRFDEVDWQGLAVEEATPPLRALVREMAFSEHATYSATQKFMQTFADDVDFTEWLAVWFYEETRHPHVLAAWLRAIGEEVDDGFVLRGRVSTPFMRSKMGTLVTNVISEVTAASAYAGMALKRQEPVLSTLARHIAGDEARHAASFFAFAARHLARRDDPERQRLDALKVLHFWLNETAQVSHPINQMLEKLLREEASGAPDVADKNRGSSGTSLAVEAADFDFDSVKRRITRLVGLLIGCDLKRVEDVLPALTEMTRALHASRRDERAVAPPGGVAGA